MKPYLTIDEAKTILSLIKSQDEESVILGLYILVSKPFKVTKLLRACIDNAQNALIEIRKEYSFQYKIKNCKNIILNSLYKYIHLQSKYIVKNTGPLGY